MATTNHMSMTIDDINFKVVEFVSWMFQMHEDYNESNLKLFLRENEENMNNMTDNIKKLIEEDIKDDPDADEDLLLKEHIEDVFEDHIRFSRL